MKIPLLAMIIMRICKIFFYSFFLIIYFDRWSLKEAKIPPVADDEILVVESPTLGFKFKNRGS